MVQENRTLLDWCEALDMELTVRERWRPGQTLSAFDFAAELKHEMERARSD
jgi:hypothetical protein